MGDVFEPRAAREAELFRALEATPADQDLRQVYADWLEEHGHFREAELIRIERRLWRDGFFQDQEERRLGFRRRKAARALGVAWKSVVTRPEVLGRRIPGCTRAWDMLTPLRPGLRQCACGDEVLWASTHREAEHIRSEGKHVVLDPTWLPDRNGTLTTHPMTATPFDLAFFRRPREAPWMHQVFPSLGLDQPDGGQHVPLVVEPAPPHPVKSLYLRHGFEPLGNTEGATYRDWRDNPAGEIRLVLRSHAAPVETWLREHYGAPFAIGDYRVYGHWLVRPRGEETLLWWYQHVPRWARDADPEIALAFVQEVVAFLRTDPGLDDAADFLSRPPRGSGIAVMDRGQSEPEDLYLRFMSGLDVLDVAPVLGFTEPRTCSDPHEMHWPLLGPKPRAGRYELGAWLEARPRDYELFTRRDRVRGISFRRL